MSFSLWSGCWASEEEFYLSHRVALYLEEVLDKECTGLSPRGTLSSTSNK